MKKKVWNRDFNYNIIKDENDGEIIIQGPDEIYIGWLITPDITLFDGNRVLKNGIMPILKFLRRKLNDNEYYKVELLLYEMEF